MPSEDSSISIFNFIQSNSIINSIVWSVISGIIEKNKKDDKLKIYFKKRLLQYKITPSYHCIIFTEKRGYEYKFNEDDYWYFFAYDDNEHDLHNFLDFRPEWALPYFEAFEFFKRNPDYALNK